MKAPLRMVVLLTVVLCVAGVLPARGQAAPVTLVTAKSPIWALAHDDGRIAWIGYRRTVHMKTLWNGRAAVLGNASTIGYGGAGGWPANFDPTLLALGRDRALWLKLSGGNILEQLLRTAALSDPLERQVGFLEYSAGGGTAVADMAGDAGTLAYAWLRFELRGGNAECSAVVDGGVVLVEGRQTRALLGAPRPAALAASAGRLALVPADESETCFAAPPIVAAENGTVEVRDTESGALVSSFTPLGRVQAVAISGPAVAVLVENSAGGRRIERYATEDGTLIGSTWVSPGTADVLDMAGDTIVFQTGYTISTMSVATGEKSALWRAAVRPLDLSVEGRRVAWVANRSTPSGTRGQIHAVLLP